MKNLQEKVKQFVEKYNLKHKPEISALDLVAEVGETAKEILKMTDYGNKDSVYRKEIESEIGDVFYSLITLANHYNIDLEKALDMILEKYKKRMGKGSAGSESD